MPKKRLHERLRELKDLVPEGVRNRIPERIKEKIRPPAWREPEQVGPSRYPVPEWSRPEWAQETEPGVEPEPEAFAPEYLTRAPAMIASSRPDGGVTAYLDAKGRKLPAPIELPYGTEGRIVRIGPDWVGFQVGLEEGLDPTGAPRAIVQIPKADVINISPEKGRDWERGAKRRAAGAIPGAIPGAIRVAGGRPVGGRGGVITVTAADLGERTGGRTGGRAG